MSLWQRLFGKKQVKQDILSPGIIEELPAADDATFYRESKRILQRLDEFITAAEAEIADISERIDSQELKLEAIKREIQLLEKPGSWKQRSLLMQYDTAEQYCKHLQQRFEIHSQNIRIYLNLMSKIEDVKAMRMNGLDEDRIETIWVEFKETMQQYKQKIIAEESGYENERVTTQQQEERLTKIRNTLLPKQAEAQKVPLLGNRPALSEIIYEDNLTDDGEDDRQLLVE